jgi:hypothetical protein
MGKVFLLLFFQKKKDLLAVLDVMRRASLTHPTMV